MWYNFHVMETNLIFTWLSSLFLFCLFLIKLMCIQQTTSKYSTDKQRRIWSVRRTRKVLSLYQLCRKGLTNTYLNILSWSIELGQLNWVIYLTYLIKLSVTCECGSDPAGEQSTDGGAGMWTHKKKTGEKFAHAYAFN